MDVGVGSFFPIYTAAFVLSLLIFTYLQGLLEYNSRQESSGYWMVEGLKKHTKKLAL